MMTKMRKKSLPLTQGGRNASPSGGAGAVELCPTYVKKRGRKTATMRNEQISEGGGRKREKKEDLRGNKHGEQGGGRGYSRRKIL